MCIGVIFFSILFFYLIFFLSTCGSVTKVVVLVGSVGGLSGS